MATKKTRSNDFGKLNRRDWVRGLITAILAGATGALLEALQSGLTIDKETLNYALIGAITGASGYLQLNLATNKKGQMLFESTKQNSSKKRIIKKQ